MDRQRYEEIVQNSREELLTNILPFWTDHGLDRTYGGLMDVMDRQGGLLSTDKGGWVQGRALWVYAVTYRDVDQDPMWLEAASCVARFIKEHLIRRSDRRAYFEVTREGYGLVMRRYMFTEMFAAMGLAIYSQISGRHEMLAIAKELVSSIDRHAGNLPVKVNSDLRPMKGHSFTMMLINLFQVMREADPDSSDYYTDRISQQIDELFSDFVQPDGILLETVQPDGSPTEGPEGRCVNPGHVIETAWFILHEALYRKDRTLQGHALALLRRHLEFGWDTKFGGLYSFLDHEGHTPIQVEWDMKYWWPHCEAIYACFLAAQITDDRYWDSWFERLYNYTYNHFPDREYGEWFGYLRRDGSLVVDLKGNHFKGPFHVPRMLLLLQSIHTRTRV